MVTLSDVEIKKEFKDNFEHESSNLNPCQFETDECALKNNADYQSLLTTMTLLHCQRLQAHKDLKQILYEKNKALNDPIGFVHKLQKNEKNVMKIPDKIDVAEIPNVNWDKYIGIVIPIILNFQFHF